MYVKYANLDEPTRCLGAPIHSELCHVLALRLGSTLLCHSLQVSPLPLLVPISGCILASIFNRVSFIGFPPLFFWFVLIVASLLKKIAYSMAMKMFSFEFLICLSYESH